MEVFLKGVAKDDELKSWRYVYGTGAGIESNGVVRLLISYETILVFPQCMFKMIDCDTMTLRTFLFHNRMKMTVPTLLA